MEENCNVDDGHEVDQTLCRVCADRAVWATGPQYNHGSKRRVHVCDPCKQFFRKTVLEELNLVYQCTGSEQGICAVNKSSRTCCRLCRYKKCVGVGMQVNATRQNSAELLYEKIRFKGGEILKSDLPKKTDVKIKEESMRWDNVKTAHDLIDDMEVARMLLDCYDLVAGNLVWSDQAKFAPPPLYATLRLQYVTPEGFEILEEIKSLGRWNRDKGPVSRIEEHQVQSAHVEKEYEDKSFSSQGLEDHGSRKSRRRRASVEKELIDDLVYIKPIKRKRRRPRRKQKAQAAVRIKCEPDEFEKVVHVDDTDDLNLKVEDSKDEDYVLLMDEDEPPTTKNSDSQSAHFLVTVREEPFVENVLDTGLKMEDPVDNPEKESISSNVTKSSKEELLEESMVDTDFDGLKMEDLREDDDFHPEKESSSEDEDDLDTDFDIYGLKVNDDPKDEDYEPEEEEEGEKGPGEKEARKQKLSQTKAKRKMISAPEKRKRKCTWTQRTIKLYECRHCSKRRYKLNDLQDHFNEIHTTEELEKQTEGTEGMPEESQVRKGQTFQPERDAIVCFHCVLCGEILTNRNDHAKLHERKEIRPLTCDSCGKVCDSVSSLYNHRRQHFYEETRVEKSICNICGKSYSNLTQHLSYHSSQRPYQCKNCGKAFKQLFTLKKHQLIHKETSPFICPHCGRGFNNETNYKGHLRIHTGEKPYKCDLCPAAFAHNVSLKSHKKSAHGIDLWKVPFKRCFEVDEDTIKVSMTASSAEQVMGNNLDGK